jgi:hypothetical protein
MDNELLIAQYAELVARDMLHLEPDEGVLGSIKNHLLENRYNTPNVVGGDKHPSTCLHFDKVQTLNEEGEITFEFDGALTVNNVLNALDPKVNCTIKFFSGDELVTKLKIRKAMRAGDIVFKPHVLCFAA